MPTLESSDFTAGSAKPSLFSLLFHRDADLSSPQSRPIALRYLVETIFDALTVEDVTENDPTALSPTKGQQWIVASGASGAWNTHDDDVAIYDGSGWVFATPTEGWELYSKAQDELYVWDGSSWIVDARAPSISAGDAGKRIRVNSGETAYELATPVKSGNDTIAGGNSTQAVTFSTAFPSANYAVALSADADERIWISGKTASGFTLNRSGTSGATNVDWVCHEYEDL